jgi:hypothetical protein
MSGPTRLRVVPIFLALLVSACSGGSLSTPAQSVVDNVQSATAAETEALSTKTALAALDSAPEAGAPSRAIFHRLAAIRPDAKAPSFLINWVSAGLSVSGTPCIGCVPNVSYNDSIGLAGPSNYVLTGAYWQYSMSFTDITFTGTCKMAWSIAAGNKVLDSFSAPKSKITEAGGFILYGYNRKRPKYSGSAVLAGKVTCGASSQTTQASLYFQ